MEYSIISVSQAIRQNTSGYFLSSFPCTLFYNHKKDKNVLGHPNKKSNENGLKSLLKTLVLSKVENKIQKNLISE